MAATRLWGALSVDVLVINKSPATWGLYLDPWFLETPKCRDANPPKVALSSTPFLEALYDPRRWHARQHDSLQYITDVIDNLVPTSTIPITKLSNTWRCWQNCNITAASGPGPWSLNLRPYSKSSSSAFSCHPWRPRVHWGSPRQPSAGTWRSH